MMEQIRELAAKLRNLFTVGEFQKRYTGGKIQIKTRNARVIEKKESFPYGFYAKAKNGKAFVICQGGNLDGFEIFPLCPGDDVTPPELEEGDAALYTASGGWVICRDSGTVELSGTGYGGVVKAPELQTQLAKLTARLDGVILALQNSPTTALDGGAAYKAAVAAALALLVNRENFSTIASDTVLHGAG
jgi:phage gp45-like